MKGIADTGFIVAFANRNDRYHSWAVDLAKRASVPFLTCEAVLAEAAFLAVDVNECHIEVRGPDTRESVEHAKGFCEIGHRYVSIKCCPTPRDPGNS